MPVGGKSWMPIDMPGNPIQVLPLAALQSGDDEA